MFASDHYLQPHNIGKNLRQPKMKRRITDADKRAAAKAAAQRAAEEKQKADAIEAAKAAWGKDFAVGSSRRHAYNVKVCRLPEELLTFANANAPAHAAAHEHAQAHAAQAQHLPAQVDLRSRMPAVYDQGALGSCTANALCALYQYDCPQVNGSRLFLYYNERRMENDIPDDAGAFLHDGIACLQKYGLCPEASWPYNVAKFAMAPPPKCYQDALAHKALVVHNIRNTESDMKASLAAGNPFAVAISVFASFETDEVSRSGVVPMPRHNEACLGGHAVVCVGYDDHRRVWIMRNSWGAGWGDRGYFTLPYAYLLDASLASDLWNITQAK